jgi:Big-like domain-containing protein/calcineurin-like phosphoesterase family protein
MSHCLSLGALVCALAACRGDSPAALPPVASVTVTPASYTALVAGTVQLRATTSDAAGNPLSGRPVTWTSSRSSVAGVSGTGFVTALDTGTTTITAASEGRTAAMAVMVEPVPAAASVLVGAGDIASCPDTGAAATAALLDTIAGVVFTAGDNAYPSGAPSDYANCYAPTWGRQKARTLPTPGNHEYETSQAAGYFGYFGAAAGDPQMGYYSYDLGDWHIIVLNVEIDVSAGSPQEQWLRADLAATSKRCKLAYWHQPRFSSGSTHGSFTFVQPLWQAMYDHHGAIVVSAHEHNYERFAPQTPAGDADSVNGIREFVVGTGGDSHYSFGPPLPNSQVRNNTTFGVLKLTLNPGVYTWQFIPVAGRTFQDSGSGSCP